VPSSGVPAVAVAIASSATAFLAAASLCLGLAAARVSGRWSGEIASAATVVLTGSAEPEAEARAVLRVLAETPGIAAARLVSPGEAAALLAPWLGEGLPLDALPVPRLVAVTETATGPDREGLRLRLAAEAPSALYDDHDRWRRPLLDAALGLQWLAATAVALTFLLMLALTGLAARASLAHHEGIVTTLRLVGATDGFVIRTFVRRFALRALRGSVAGTLAAALAVLLLPGPDEETALLTRLAPRGPEWLALIAIPPAAALAAVLATRAAVRSALRRLP
jgi:cell division transport system permease protein